MNRLPLLPLILALTCWREKSSPLAADPKPSKTTATMTGDATPRAEPGPYLLETPRIRISRQHEMISLPAGIGAEADAILQDIRGLPPSSVRDNAISSLIGDLAKEDPARARRMLREWVDGLAFPWREAARSVGVEIAKTDPGMLVDFITKEVPSAMRAEVWATSLSFIPPVERSAYLEHVAESREKLVMMADMLAAWTAADARAAAAWLDGFVTGRSVEEIALLGEPVHAVGKLGEPIPGSQAESWLEVLRYATNAEARAFLAREVLKRTGDAPTEALLGELAVAEPGIADLVRDRRIQHDAAGFAASLDPREIAALSPEVAAELIEWWARKQPRSALDWAMEHGRPEAATALMALYYQEPREAVRLAPSLASGKERDFALRGMCALEASDGKAESAKGLLPLITDPEQREVTRRNVEQHLESWQKEHRR